MLNKTRNLLKKLRHDRRGNVLALVGLGLIPMVGTAGLAVDAAQWVTWKRQLHSAADLGAVAGAEALVAGQDADAAVRRALGHNSGRSYTIETIETPILTGDFAGSVDMVKVVLSTQETLPFSSMFLASAPTIRVEAIAQGGSEVPNCMVALDTTGTGISISGSASVNMNCGLISNSNFDATTSDLIKAGALSAVGFVTDSGAVTTDTKINQGVAPSPDPYAGLFSDPNQVCNNWPLIKGTASLSAGCYAGIQVTNNSTLTLSPGVYVIGEKGITVGGNATLTGDGVTLIFTNTSSPFNASRIGTFEGNGTSNIQLSAPDSGTYAGMLMIQDSRTMPSNTNDLFITGDSGSVFDGAIYAPSNQVTFTGNSSMNTDCLQIVSRYISFAGDTDVANTCPVGRGALSLNGHTVVRLRK